MRKSCLIVDDSPAVRAVLARLLRGLDFAVSEAEDGARALAVCESALPDVIVLDRMMPVMDGLTFLRALRAGAGGERPKVIVCSSLGQPEEIAAALDAGADEYVMKPFDEGILRCKLEQTGML